MSEHGPANDNLEKKDRQGPRTVRNEKRRRIFLVQLAASSHVTASAGKAGIALSTIYEWRDHDPEFATAWNGALAKGYELLEMEMLGRARGGIEKKIYSYGKYVDTVTEYNDAVALRLLQIHRETVVATRAAKALTGNPESDIRDRLNSKFNEMREKIQRRKAAEQAEPEGE